jgi:hypothetical protein
MATLWYVFFLLRMQETKIRNEMAFDGLAIANYSF